MAKELIKCLITLLGVGTVTVNILVMLVVGSTPHLRKDITGRLMISNAVGDLGCGLCSPCVSAALAWLQLNPVPRWLPILVYSSNAGFGTATVAHQCFIAIVTCIVIVKPFTHEEILSKHRVYVAIVFLWAFSIAFALVQFVEPFKPDFNTELLIMTSRGLVDKNLLVFFIAQYVVITCIILSCYGIVFVVIWKHKRKIADINQPTDTNSSAAINILESIRSAKNMFIVFAVFLAVFLTMILTPYTSPSVESLGIALWINQLHSFTTSFLYIVLHKKVRDIIKLKICQWFKIIGKEETSDSVTSSTSVEKF